MDFFPGWRSAGKFCLWIHIALYETMGCGLLLAWCNFTDFVDFVCKLRCFTFLRITFFVLHKWNDFDYLQYVAKTFICYEQPRNHPFISDDEREYLQRKIDDYENERKDLPSTPWMAIIRSSPVLALVLSTVIHSYVHI